MRDRSDHLDLTRREFGLQARAMSGGRSFNATEAIEPFVRMLRTPLPRPVLDLACGPGIVSHALARAGAEVVGVDATPEMVAIARQRCADARLESAHFQEGDAYSLPFEAGHFAGAVTRLSVHHFEEPARAFEELRRVLRQESPIVVGDIVVSSDPAKARLHNALETLRDPSHHRFLTDCELQDAVSAAGFQVDAVEAWRNPKSFEEWAAVVEDARSALPLREVMESLARAGVDAGFDLRIEDGALRFTHHWCFIRARAV